MAELPSGTVTFLFTDIEGSTRLVKQLRERYADVLAEHHRLLRTAFEAHGGYEVDTAGDGFFVAFANARDALLAAVEGQLALLTHAWPEDGEVRVRMGLHTGQAVATGGRYTGLAVHRAARIGAAAHGGQVIVSQATQTLLEDEEEDLHVFLRDLGEQRLKDLDRPVRLYQAAADGLPRTFPPPRSSAGLAEVAEAAISTPWWRRPAVVAAAGLVLVAAIVAVVVLATRSSGGGLAGIRPNHVGIIDPGSNEIVSEVTVGIRPGPISVGGGSVWVGNVEDRTLTRIDPRRRSPTGTISLENRTPTGVAVGNGAVWVAHGLLGSLSRVDPQFNQVSEIAVGAGRSNQGSVAVGDGAVWAVYGDSTLVRVDSVSARPTGLGFAGAAPAAVVVAAGSVWVANAGDATVHRYSSTTFEQGPIATFNVGRRPSGIAFAAGAIWVADTGDDAVTRIDPNSNSTITIPVGDGPTAVAAGAGAVWVANTTEGTVSRIDPATNDVEAIEVGSAPAGIAVGEGFVWVPAHAP